MIAVKRDMSKSSDKPWLCPSCTFENSALLDICQVCGTAQQKVQQHEQKQIKPINAEVCIICVNCTFKNKIDAEVCEVCNITIYQKQPRKMVKFDPVLCRYCSFENAPDNLLCIKCERFMDAKADVTICPHCYVEISIGDVTCAHCRSPPKQQYLEEEYEQQYYGHEAQVKFDNCPLCLCVLDSSLYARHVKDCTESMNLIQKMKNDLEVEKIEERCPFCNIEISKFKIEQHITDCQKNSQFFKKQQVFGRMTKLQIECIQFMHSNSQKQHFSAKPLLQARFRKLGYTVDDLENLHHYIENYAPIIVHVHVTKHMEFFIKDTNYRNQFETNKSSGSLSRTSRTTWENRMFFKKYAKATDFQRVKYGTVNFTNDPKGVNSCRGYGASYLMLKPQVRERCTMTDMDSSSATSLIATFKFCYHIINKFSDQEIKAAVNAAKANEVSSQVVTTYKQIQIHGPIEFSKDIQKLYVNKIELQDPKYLKMVEQFSKIHKVDYEVFS